MKALRTFAVLGGAAALIALAPARAGAEDLAAARALYLAADFRGARAAYEGALESAELDAADAAEAHAALTALLLMLGETEEARLHAEAAAALDPTVAPPEGAPEDAADLLREAGAREGRATLRIRVAPADESVGEVGVTLRLRPAPRLLAAALRLDCGEVSRTGPPPEIALEVSVPTSGLRCEGAALTAAGASLLETTRELVLREPARPSESGAPPPEEVGPEERRPWPGWLWVGVGAGVLLLAGIATTLALTLGGAGGVQLTETDIEGW